MSSLRARRTCSSSEDGGRRLRSILHSSAQRLAAAGIDAPRLTAELLLAHALGVTRLDVVRRADESLLPEHAARYEMLLARRLAHEPIQHILGRTEFWSHPILCDRRALIPRPETELLVEVALGLLANRRRRTAEREGASAAERSKPSAVGDAASIADIGTGTGCIAVALAAELPQAVVYASDISRDALDLARENLRLNGLEGRVRLVEGDLTEPYRLMGLVGQFDLVVSNPPYIPDGDIPGLQPEVCAHDPRSALAGGPDGLRVIQRLLEDVPALLRLNGHLAIEIGAGEAGAVQDMIRRSAGTPARRAWRSVEVHRDGAGIERVITMQKAKQPCHGHLK